ncbi:transaldolase [Patescibacteria group bacterium]|nr:transaldolase [Patescibacteria group bacterium]
MSTKIFLDSGDPADTREALILLGTLDGQTTNPSLIAKNPDAQARLLSGDKFSAKEINDFYKKVINEIAALISSGAISIEVYADKNTATDKITEQARAMYSWCESACIKIPITKNGLEAAKILSAEGMRLNMTLCFSQDQAAAVYSATKGAKKGQIFVSPFIGRLDDIGQNGVDLIKNILKMYKDGDGHIEVLAASIRHLDHLLACLSFKTDIVTAPLNTYAQWVEAKKVLPEKEFDYNNELTRIDYKEIDLNKNWQDFNIEHDLTSKGLEKFSSDWNSLIK